jgi:hypothetical protein
MMDEPFDPNKVLITLPVYILANQQGTPFTDSTYRAGPLLPIFSDKDLAERFVAALGGPPGIVVTPVPREKTVAYFERLAGLGFQRVAIDPTGRQGDRVGVLPLANFIEAARRTVG